MGAEHDHSDIVVIALGGNAIARFGDDGTIAAQYRRAEEAMQAIADLACGGARIVLTHGNGPVVGNIVLRGELSKKSLPPTPLFIAGADSEGGMGLMLQQVLGNELRRRRSTLVPATVVTQVVVNAADPAFAHPTKPIGPYYRAEETPALIAECGWDFAEEPGRGWRRVVPSPQPLRTVEAPAVSALLSAGLVPIAAGGGGVPVVEAPDGMLTGVEAVIDKDWTGALLAHELGAKRFVILMEADALYDDFGLPTARRVPRLSGDEARDRAATLPAGGIGPKVAAAAWFARRGGTTVLCRVEEIEAALAGEAGTTVAPD